MATVSRRIVVALGALSPAVVVATFVGGGVASPAYAWPTDPFSIVGTTDGVVATLFNAGLILAGLLALPFAVRLWRAVGPLVGGLYAVVGVSLVGAGLVPARPGAVVHGIAGAVVFLGIWLVPWAAARREWAADEPRAAATSLLLGAVALVVWLPYDLGVTRAQVGYGAAELVSMLAFAMWSGWTAVRLWRGSGPRSPVDRGEPTP